MTPAGATVEHRAWQQRQRAAWASHLRQNSKRPKASCGFACASPFRVVAFRGEKQVKTFHFQEGNSGEAGGEWGDRWRGADLSGLREGGSIRKRGPDLGVNEGNPRHTHVFIPPYTLTEVPHTPTSQLRYGLVAHFPSCSPVVVVVVVAHVFEQRVIA